MFDARNFLKDKFGSPAGVIAFVTAYGYPPPSTGAVEKWFQRNGLPGDWFAILVCLLEVDTGGPISLIKYIMQK